MRVLWVGDVGVSSGFAYCTKAVCDHLHELGHEVHVLGLNWHGRPDVQAQLPYHLWPCIDPVDGGKDGFGISRLPVLVERLRPDVIVLLNDPWNVPQYLGYFDQWNEGRNGVGADPVDLPTVVGWLAVDAKNQHAKPLNRLAHVAVWTEFARDELKRGGYLGESSIIPLGVDTTIFERKDRGEARKVVFGGSIPDGAFVVGAVGRNQPRKRLDLTIQYFSEWIHRHGIDDAYLYLHVGPTGDKGVDIQSLVSWHGLGRDGKFGTRVLVGRPNIGQGYAQSVMPYIYSAMDVYLTTTSGEGWGLPALEAMACEVPVIAPDWSGLGCWAKGAADLVPCSSTCMNAPLNSQAYTIGGVMDREGCVESLQAHYEASKGRAEARIALAGVQGRQLAEYLTWESAAEKFAAMLHEVTGKKPVPKYQVSLFAPADGVSDGEALVFHGVDVLNESSSKVRGRVFLESEDGGDQAGRFGSMSGLLGPGAVYLEARQGYSGDLVFTSWDVKADRIVIRDETDVEIASCPVSIPSR